MATRDMPPTGEPEPGTRFEPFADDVTVQTVGGLSIENGTDRIAIHGSVDLARDAAGLTRAKALAATLSAIITALEGQALPERVADATRPSVAVKNPFA
jgi:hypothetical protein